MRSTARWRSRKPTAEGPAPLEVADRLLHAADGDRRRHGPADRLRLVSEAAEPHPVAKLPLVHDERLLCQIRGSPGHCVPTCSDIGSYRRSGQLSLRLATPAAAAINLAQSIFEDTFRRRVPPATAGGAR